MNIIKIIMVFVFFVMLSGALEYYIEVKKLDEKFDKLSILINILTTVIFLMCVWAVIMEIIF